MSEPYDFAKDRNQLLWDVEQLRARVKELENWRTAVLSIVDGLDDPYVGLTWIENSHGDCARELEHLRSVLVPLVRGEDR